MSPRREKYVNQRRREEPSARRSLLEVGNEVELSSSRKIRLSAATDEKMFVLPVDINPSGAFGKIVEIAGRHEGTERKAGDSMDNCAHAVWKRRDNPAL